MKTIKITADQAHEMQQPFLKSADKKRLDITGYQFLRGWYVDIETEMAYKISALNESGTAIDTEIEEIETWIPKSQTIIFESAAEEMEDGGKLIFIKTWLYNQEKSTFKINHFSNFAY